MPNAQTKQDKKDKALMEHLLNDSKGLCNLLMFGAVESDSNTVHDTFSDVLEENITLQHRIYEKMAEKGWYKLEKADKKCVDAALEKFNPCNQ